MRVFSNSLMTALIVVALFWGNCLSCPQLFAAAAAPVHGCCHHKNPQPAAKVDCQSQALGHFVQTEKSIAPAPSLPATIVSLPEPVLQLSLERSDAPAHNPPDLISLNSTFRI
jgi:hypothetical protein